jgi:hypothetical protein
MNDQVNHSNIYVIYAWLTLIALSIVLMTFCYVSGFVL